MSCGCNTNPCSCQPRPSLCCAPTVESVSYTFENANLTGLGVFDNETDNLVQFRGVVSDSASLTITLNATDNTLVFAFDSSALVADIPDATTTQRGILETATDAEALAKALNNKILTPSNLAALGSTTTFAGLVELATNAETIAGISATLAVTPAGLTAAQSNYVPVTFNDAAARAGATPGFVGQIGTQEDDYSMWVGKSLVAGSWNRVFTDGVVNFFANGSGTSFQASTGTIYYAGAIDYQTAVVNFSAGSFSFYNGATLQVQVDGIVDITPGVNTFKLSGVSVPANSLLGTGAGAGTLNSRLVNTFLSTANTQTGWAVTNPSISRTLDVSAATLGDVRAVLGTLINDLKSVLLPAT